MQQVQEAKVLAITAQQQVSFGVEQVPKEVRVQLQDGWKIASVVVRQSDFDLVQDFVEVFYLVRDVVEPAHHLWDKEPV